MKIIVTGGSGFIGSTVIKLFLKEKKHKILNVDNLSYASCIEAISNEIKNHRLYEFAKVDICNKKKLKEIFNKFKPNIIMHLAAESHVDRPIESSDLFIKTNIIGTHNLLEVSKEYFESLHNSQKKKFLFHHVSTDEVYGSLSSTDRAFTEKSRYMQNSPYSASKASSDHLVRAWFETYNLPALITNCSNNYGPYQFPEKLIPLVITRALRGLEIPIYGDGLNIRDWIFVEDHAKALINVIENGKVGQIYNIGASCEKTNLEVVSTICNILDKLKPRSQSTDKKYFDLVKFVKDRPGHDRRYAIDSSKIRNELNWTPSENFDSGMYKTVEWYLKNLDWCNRIFNNNYKSTRLGLV